MFSIPTEVTRTTFQHVPATFENPIAPGADPWVVRHGGYYFWCLTEQDLGVAVYRSTSLTALGEKCVVWRAARQGPYSGQVWAPELHRLDGRWYIYVAVSDGNNANHRMIVLESSGDDPTKPFHFKAELYTGDDFAGRTANRWAIDATVLELAGRRYCLWSGWEDERDAQWLYIAPMSNPWTLSAARVRLCANDDFVWERVGGTRRGRGLNEGPQVLQRNGRTFVVYSCSGSWEPTYKLALLELLPGRDPLTPASWRKHERPVFQATEATCGVGHCSFTQSPDGREDWIVYHAKVSPAHGWQRMIHVQPFSWDKAGVPVFGVPVGAHASLERPSGEYASTRAPGWETARALIKDIHVRRVADEASGERLSTN